jgi:hypothetical protein
MPFIIMLKHIARGIFRAEFSTSSACGGNRG